MKLSARNILKGKVTKINYGSVISEVVIKLPGGDEIVSTITKTSLDSLRIDVGKNVFAIIKSSNVLIGVD